jgi:hypothetical protein
MKTPRAAAGHAAPRAPATCNADGQVNFDDINGFVAILGGN